MSFEKKKINKSKIILTALLLIFLASGDASAGLGKKLKEKVAAAKKAAQTTAKSIQAGDSPLHIAVRSGNVESMKEICSKCDNDPTIINAQNLNGETPLELAFNWESGEYRREFFYGLGWRNTPLDPENKRNTMIKYLIDEALVDVNIPSKDGTSLLSKQFYSNSRGGDFYAIKLISAGANVMCVNKEMENSFSIESNKNFELFLLLFYIVANDNNKNKLKLMDELHEIINKNAGNTFIQDYKTLIESLSTEEIQKQIVETWINDELLSKHDSNLEQLIKRRLSKQLKQYSNKK